MRDSSFSVKWMWLVELVLVLAVAIMPRILTLGPTFVVNDETLYWSWSNDFAKALLNRDWAGTIVGDVYPSVTVMWVQAVGFVLRWLWGWLTHGLDASFFYQLGLDRPLDFALLWQRRLPMALANAGLVVLIYYYVRRLWGRRVALVGLVLIVLDPSRLTCYLHIPGPPGPGKPSRN